MRGLVFAETLSLSLVQWAAILGVMWLYLSQGLSWNTLLAGQCGLTLALWQAGVSVDTRLLFQAAARLAPFEWSAFLSEFAHQNYVFLQPPFYTFLMSRAPGLGTQQLLFLPWGIVAGLLLWALFGERARLLAATPVFLLMSVQPSNDFVLFVLLLASLRAAQLGHKAAAALLWGLAYPVKPLAVLLAPCMMLRLQGWGIISVGIWGLYVRWSLGYYFGVRQWNFLLRQLCLN